VGKNKKLVVDLSKCEHPEVCPLSRLRVGGLAKIKKLPIPPAIAERLREMGVYEDQEVKLVLKGNNVICQVCNARLGLSTQLAENILVEPLPTSPKS
jgi:Fe2+ transport system protein FeoA